MSTGKDVLIEFLLELLKEERDQRRRGTEENTSLIKDLIKKFENMETELILDRHSRHSHRRVGRIICDGDEDEVDGFQHSWLTGIPRGANNRCAHVGDTVVWWLTGISLELKLYIPTSVIRWCDDSSTVLKIELFQIVVRTSGTGI